MDDNFTPREEMHWMLQRVAEGEGSETEQKKARLLHALARLYHEGRLKGLLAKLPPLADGWMLVVEVFISLMQGRLVPIDTATEILIADMWGEVVEDSGLRIDSWLASSLEMLVMEAWCTDGGGPRRGKWRHLI